MAQALVAYGQGDSAAVLADRLRAKPALLGDVAARLLEDRAAGSRLVLIVDQFEEVFTLCHRNDERIAFFDALVHAAQVPDGPISVAVAIRGDYYGHCSVHQELARLLAANHLLVGPMSPSEIRTAIEEPAHRAGLAIDHDLVDRVVDDASGAAGVLPLLSTAMLETWNRRRDGRLTLDAYLTTGGVHGAIARLAESVYEELSPDQRGAVRYMLLRLAELGEDGDDVRRRAPLDELVTSAAHQEVLDVLVSHRLVTVDGGRVEVAHEALLREWPRLRTWLEEDRAGRALHRRLTADARAWDEAGGPEDLLLRGMRLDSAVDWATGHEGELHPLEQAYLNASSAAWQRELASSRRAARRFRALAVGLAVLLVAAVAAGVLAQVQRNQARTRARVAEAGRLANLSEVAGNQDLTRAVLLAIESWRTDENRDTEGVLLAAAQRYGTSDDVLHVPISGTFDVSSTDMLATTDVGQDVVLWDLRATSSPEVLETEAYDVQFSPDGSLVAAFTLPRAGQPPEIEVWDVAAATARRHHDATGLAERRPLRRLAWRARLVTRRFEGGARGCNLVGGL